MIIYLPIEVTSYHGELGPYQERMNMYEEHYEVHVPIWVPDVERQSPLVHKWVPVWVGQSW